MSLNLDEPISSINLFLIHCILEAYYTFKCNNRMQTCISIVRYPFQTLLLALPELVAYRI